MVALKRIAFVFATCFLHGISMCQTFGLKGLIVERYYEVDKQDVKKAADPRLQSKSITYRLFVDMEQGYTFQAVFGSAGHPIMIGTTTSFYNHAENGNNVGNLIYEKALAKGATMLDSWISVGAASLVHLGIPKADDDTLQTVKNESEMLQKKSGRKDISLSERDGLKKMPHDFQMPLVTPLNIDPLLKALQDTAAERRGFHFESENASWACIGGSSNVYGGKNRVLIGQFTTDGEFYFKLNVQLGTPQGGYQQYVLEKPNPGQVACPFLTYGPAQEH